MNKKYDVKNPIEIDGREKPLWASTGQTITITDEGKVFLFDARTGSRFPAFERPPREDKQAKPQDAPADDFHDQKIPF